MDEEVKKEGEAAWKPVETPVTSGGGTGGNPGGNGPSAAKADIHGLVNQLEALLDEYMVKKAPFQLPLGLKEFLAKVTPYLIIIFAVLFLPALFALIGLSSVLAPFGMATGQYGWGWYGIVSLATGALTFVLEVMAVPGLFKRTHKAWRLLFYASIVSLVGGVLSLYGIVGSIIGAVIGWYILFQMKDMYKN